MQQHTITGGGGVKLHVVESGNPDGKPILFIHGFSQCGLAWTRQLNSELAERHRLVAMDLRGHGRSDKPRDAYGDAKLWADDVHAVITTLGLDRPVLCGWSYGPLVMMDYVRHYGEDAIAGMVFVCGISKLGSDAAVAVIGQEFLSLIPGFFATDVEESVRSLDSLLRLCVGDACRAEELYLMLGYNLAVPPHVRQGLFARAFDNDDLMPALRKPVLLVHGALDTIVKPIVVDQHKAAIPHARVAMMAGAGHAPFYDDAAVFNGHLRSFCEQLESEAVTAGQT